MVKGANFKNQKAGWIEIICGPMFAGKTDELLKYASKLKYTKLNLLFIKPFIDNRTGINFIKSRNNMIIEAIPAKNTKEIYNIVEKNQPEILFIDEVQFFDKDIVDLCNNYAKAGITIFCAGLDTDFRGEPFGCIPGLLSISDKVHKLTAFCSICGAEACRSQRLINKMPAPYDSDTIVIGSKESYEPRCRQHHIIEKIK